MHKFLNLTLAVSVFFPYCSPGVHISYFSDVLNFLGASFEMNLPKENSQTLRKKTNTISVMDAMNDETVNADHDRRLHKRWRTREV